MDEVEDCAGWMTAPGLTDSNTVIYIYNIYIIQPVAEQWLSGQQCRAGKYYL